MVMAGTEGEDMIIDCMSNWVKFAKYTTSNEMFFSRWSTNRAYKRKRLNSAMVAENIKDCARRFKVLPDKY